MPSPPHYMVKDRVLSERSFSQVPYSYHWHTLYSSFLRRGSFIKGKCLETLHSWTYLYFTLTPLWELDCVGKSKQLPPCYFWEVQSCFGPSSLGVTWFLFLTAWSMSSCPRFPETSQWCTSVRVSFNQHWVLSGLLQPGNSCPLTLDKFL